MSKNPKIEANEQARPSDAEPSNPGPADAESSNVVKDPHDWTTGGESMTGAQASYLKTLSEEAHEPFDETLNKADASLKIDELQTKTGRGKNH